LKEIHVEEREASEIRSMDGLSEGRRIAVNIMPDESPVSNYGFDITPSRLVSGLITERGICEADEGSILKLFPEK